MKGNHSKSMKRNHGILWSVWKRGGAKLLDSDGTHGTHAGAWKDPGGIDRPSSNYEVVQTVASVLQKKFTFFGPPIDTLPKNFTFFAPPIYALPNFRQFFGKVENAISKKTAKFRPGFRSLETPHEKEDSQCERRIGQKSTKIAKKSPFFWWFVFANLRAAANSDRNRNVEVIYIIDNIWFYISI